MPNTYTNQELADALGLHFQESLFFLSDLLEPLYFDEQDCYLVDEDMMKILRLRVEMERLSNKLKRSLIEYRMNNFTVSISNKN